MASETDTADLFKLSFKKYKRREKQLDLSTVFDADTFADGNHSVSRVDPCANISNIGSVRISGLRPQKEWNIFSFKQHEGFYLIQNPFESGYQRYWVARCMQDLPRPPNVTNLRVHPELDPDTLWSQFAAQYKEGASVDDSSLRKLRWTTIGYHYNWDTKEYNEKDYTPFPEDIGVLAQHVTEVLGFPYFQPEAGIINYYHMDSTLGGHTDHSELDHQAPLVSISFGQDAIFLLGGETKATEPTAIRLHSGDICIMSGPSRLAYHAIPKILPSKSGELTLPPSFDFPLDENVLGGGDSCVLGEDEECSSSRSKEVEQGCVCSKIRQENKTGSGNNNTQSPTLKPDGGDSTESSSEAAKASQRLTKIDADLVDNVNKQIREKLKSMNWSPFAGYLSSSRINVNIRQVLGPGQTFLKAQDSCLGDSTSKKPRID